MTSGRDEAGYYLKRLLLNDSSQSILLQNKNGPCALIAIANVLVLRDSPMAAYTAQHSSIGLIEEPSLLAKLGDCVCSNSSISEVESVFEFLPKMSKGLDVNPKFDGTFCHSPELDVFSAFDIKLVHGWVLGDLESDECNIKVGDAKSYSELSYEQICAAQFSDQPNYAMTKFIEHYPTQMTPSGLLRLQSSLDAGELAVLFWNNHFSTIIRHNDEICSLVIDLGFQDNASVVWEQLSLGGAGRLLNGTFNDTEKEEAPLINAPKVTHHETPKKDTPITRPVHQKPPPKKKEIKKRSSPREKKRSKCIIA